MAGKLGRSGRKSWEKEIQAKELWNLSVPVLKYALKSRSKALYMKKIDIALALINKMLPQEVKGEGIIPIIQFVNFGEPIADNKNTSRFVPAAQVAS